ncbi:MAG: BlaI/MecI/CopY family transcriptional regulator [Gammaproteobacteria bacterium]|nr:BlaI/MecI/CopY family transcriptional regulator [Gammaproteobacteria bacterium]
MKLSEFELDVMQQVWRAEERSAPEVHRAVAEARGVTYSTVKTIMDRLERKGVLVRSRQEGRTIFYKAVIPPDEIQQSMLERFVTHVFAGDRRPMWNFLLRDERLSPEEYRYLEDLLARQQPRQEGSSRDD